MGFEPDVSLVSLGGKLELLLAPSVESNDLVGKTYKLFDWTETAHTGQFHIESDPRWDVSQLYTTGEISFVSEPTTPLGMGVCIIWLFAYITRSRVMDHG